MDLDRRVRLVLLGSALVLGACGRSPIAIDEDGSVSGDGSLVDGLVAADTGPGERGPLPDGRRPDAQRLGPDLWVKKFAATVSVSTVTYTVEACNIGQSAAGPFNIGITYDSASAPTKPADQSYKINALDRNICHTVTIKRTQTPDGTYKSWVRLDPEGKVAESDELNNGAGPVTVTVKAPPQPDLMIKTFTAQVSGDDIVYTIEVCNTGTAASWLFRLELYYTRVLAPGAYMIGDQNVYFLTGLAANTCKSVTRTYSSAPVGLYNSWAQVDALNTVAESNEQNNVAGPRLVTVSPASGCVAICTLATTCGVFQISEFGQCLSWCSSFNQTAKACAQSAQQAQSCSALKACSLPAKPPPPPPPWACLTLCNYLVQTCKLVQQNQALICVGGCISLPSTKVQCAWDAMNKKQCVQMGLCLL